MDACFKIIKRSVGIGMKTMSCSFNGMHDRHQFMRWKGGEGGHCDYERV